MGWWPFSRKRGDRSNEPQVKGTRSWLQDLRGICEKFFDDHASGKEGILKLQNEWREAHQRSELTDELIDGLEIRATRLLSADENSWIDWLDDEGFWKPGWRENNGE